ncbi:MAG: DUF4097 domain-containing protein, partial [Planctomycetes bacterium]|nr:DUF4097 domain-containing protein [Planctomycetota bacterium]
GIYYQEPQVKYVQVVDLAEPIAANSELVLMLDDGDLDLAGVDDELCSLTLTVTGWAPDKEQARMIVEAADPRLERTGNRVSLVYNKPKGNNLSVDIGVAGSVLRSCSLDISIDDGDAEVRHFTNDLSVNTDDGDIYLTDITGAVKATADDGDVQIREIIGDVELTVDDGDAHLKEINGNVDFDGDDGKFRIEELTGDIKGHLDDGKMTVHYRDDATGASQIILTTDDCPIDLKLPAGFAGKVEIIADDGDITCDRDITITGEFDNSKIKHITGTIGTGEGSLYIKTDDGRVRIR